MAQEVTVVAVAVVEQVVVDMAVSGITMVVYMLIILDLLDYQTLALAVVVDQQMVQQVEAEL
jgi:hypothetical protein